MEFRRISNLPPYVFAQVNQLKAEARRAGEGPERSLSLERSPLRDHEA